MDIDEIIKKQKQLQRDFDFPIDADDIETKTSLLYAYSVGAMKEISEIMDEYSWKPWASDLFINRSAVISETADTFLFLVNMLATLDCSEDEFLTTLQAKQKKNTARASGEYTHKTNKCLACERALDDFYTADLILAEDIILCPICGAK